MPRRRTLLVNLIVALGLILSGQVAITPLPLATSEARIVAPAGAAKTDDAPRRRIGEQTASKTTARTSGRIFSGAGRRRTTSTTTSRRTASRSQSRQPSVGDWREYCTGPDMISLLAIDLCTHGPDPAPPGFDANQPLQPLSPEEAAQLTSAFACDGVIGEDGFRVQVLYDHASDMTSRYDEYVARIRLWAAEADQIFQQSAGDTLGSRALRFAPDPTNCEPTVLDVERTAVR
jgi:hypothetical protein